MFLDKTIQGADYSASQAATASRQTFDGAIVPLVSNDSITLPEVCRGTWFDEGYDFREPVGTAFTMAVLAAIATVETRKKTRRAVDQCNHEIMVRKLIANAIRCHSFHSPALVAVQLRASAYRGKPTWLNGKAMARTTKLLSDAGLIERTKGKHGKASTTFVPSGALLSMALEAGATEQTLIYRMPADRTLRLRKGNRDTELIDFEFNVERQDWAKRLATYNKFLSGQDIAIDLTGDGSEILTARMNEERSRGKLPYVKPELVRKCLYRQFNNNSFDDGGRLYGGWWINCPKLFRQSITINGKSTVELDFSGCLIRMLYHLQNIDYLDDPYRLAPLAECEQAHHLGDDYFREPVKRMMQALINGQAGKQNERIRLPNMQTFRPYFSRLEVEEMLKVKHYQIANKFHSGAGIKLQRIESDISLDIITKFANDGVACLPVHDSFIISYEHIRDLEDIMIYIYNSIIGYNPLIKISV